MNRTSQHRAARPMVEARFVTAHGARFALRLNHDCMAFVGRYPLLPELGAGPAFIEFRSAEAR